MSYLTCLDNDLKKSEEFNVQTYKRHYEFQNLTQLTKYKLKLALSNFYIDKLSMDLQFGANVKLTTTSKLNAPEDMTIKVLTHSIAAVYWMPFKKLNCVAMNYYVYWSPVLFPNSTQEQIVKRNMKVTQLTERTLDGKFFAIIPWLLPKQIYNIFVRVRYLSHFNSLSADSLSKTVYMKPNNLTLSGVSTNSMNISLISRVNLTIHTGFSYTLKYRKYEMRKWQIANSTEVNNDKITFYIKNLLPQTVYEFRLILSYPEHLIDFMHSYSPPEEFTFETFGNVPSAPGIPTIMRLLNLTLLNWEPAQANDSQVTLYRLEGLIVEDNYEEGNQIDKDKYWNSYYNGTNNYWIITRNMDQKYQFRVQAENAYGVGVWSKLSAIVDLTESMQYLPYLYNYLLLMLSLVITLVICYVYCSYRRRQAMVYNLDEFALTKIKKNQITLGELLGSGTFGKVYQGTVKDFEGSETMPIAIKMLPKDASSQEKIKFLEEANVMSDFHHKHVLRLLGTCVDTDSPWLILELMEAGDLLKYLRENRTLLPSDRHALRLQDLLAMCEDVARGCCYLEEQHFVHRDLACRNCLISARNRENPIVKISDFGLSRDIYEKDYYRMEGGTKLPVRWMAPESLMNGIFTSQSDVWAFGVVMWEITSLGQKPYAAIHNCNIRHYVCAGNKLLKPLNCPQALYELMLCCWNAVKRRPKFKLCLRNIETLKIDIEDTMLISEIPDISGHVQSSEISDGPSVGIITNRTTERLTANDALNDVIESLT